MEQRTSFGLFRMRNILSAVLVAGIAAGVYLSDFFKGFGLGAGNGKGIIPGHVANSSATSSSNSTSDSGEEIVPAKTDAPDVVKVVISEWSYFLRTDSGEEKIELPQIVDLVKAAKGDSDGIRIRIYRKLSSRAKAESDLENALTAAGIQEKELVFMPVPKEN